MPTEIRIAPRLLAGPAAGGLVFRPPAPLQRRFVGDVDLGALRARRGEASAGELRGYAIVFNQLSENLGGFRELVLPGAIELEDDVVALVSHDMGRILGRTRSRTVELKVDDTGLAFRIELPETATGQEVAELVQRGDIDGMSFGFTTLKDRWIWEADPAVRQLVRIRVHEISPVAWPAYPDTSVAKRSLAAARAGALRADQHRRLQRARLRALR